MVKGWRPHAISYCAKHVSKTKKQTWKLNQIYEEYYFILKEHKEVKDICKLENGRLYKKF